MFIFNSCLIPDVQTASLSSLWCRSPFDLPNVQVYSCLYCIEWASVVNCCFLVIVVTVVQNVPQSDLEIACFVITIMFLNRRHIFKTKMYYTLHCSKMTVCISILFYEHSAWFYFINKDAVMRLGGFSSMSLEANNLYWNLAMVKKICLMHLCFTVASSLWALCLETKVCVCFVKLLCVFL